MIYKVGFGLSIHDLLFIVVNVTSLNNFRSTNDDY